MICREAVIERQREWIDDMIEIYVSGIWQSLHTSFLVLYQPSRRIMFRWVGPRTEREREKETESMRVCVCERERHRDRDRKKKKVVCE